MPLAKPSADQIYETIARSLREFGYADTTAAMVEEVALAMNVGNTLPHGVVGLFASNQINDVKRTGFDLTGAE